MAWDLGAGAVLELAAVAVLVGLVAESICGPDAPAWLWVRVFAVYFIVGTWIADAWFGWVVPGGWSLEDVLLVALAPLPAVILVTRSSYHGRGRRTAKSAKPSRHPTRHAL